MNNQLAFLRIFSWGVLMKMALNLVWSVGVCSEMPSYLEVVSIFARGAKSLFSSRAVSRLFLILRIKLKWWVVAVKVTPIKLVRWRLQALANAAGVAGGF
ncbi:hypothetical protein QY882_04890 [Latilactobacillus sakei]